MPHLSGPEIALLVSGLLCLAFAAVGTVLSLAGLVWFFRRRRASVTARTDALEALGWKRTGPHAWSMAMYGTTVAFRGAGRERDDLGFTYNVSSGGIYVRTLAPPDEDETWIELRPPRSDRLVRLVAKIAWRRRFNHNENATVPPGFGAQIIDGARADLEAWNAGNAAMQAALG
jgi:hypothetical protein